MEMPLKNERLLVISPHCDDETFGCGGTIIKAKDLGCKVYVMVVSVGDIRQYHLKQEVDKREKREEEFKKAMSFLKVDDYDILFEDTEKHMRLDSLPRRDLVDLIEKDSKLSIEKLQPTIIAIPAISYNQDHEAVFKAAFTACRPHIPTIKPFQKVVLVYDSPTLSWDPYNRGFHPNFYVDISKYIDQKIQAISIYETQLRLYIHQHSKDTIMSLATLRGREVAVEAAEGFMCQRFVI